MRKILLSSTSMVAAATIASYATADVSVTGAFDWKYSNISSNVAASDGTKNGDKITKLLFHFQTKLIQD